MIEIRCRDLCGNSATFPDDQPPPGDWHYLAISRTYRCPKCTHELMIAEGLIGPDIQTEDTLDPASRGALPKETASTIILPAVKG